MFFLLPVRKTPKKRKQVKRMANIATQKNTVNVTFRPVSPQNRQNQSGIIGKVPFARMTSEDSSLQNHRFFTFFSKKT